MSKYKREIGPSDWPEMEYSDGHHWMMEREVCKHCIDERDVANRPYRYGQERISFGVYAGRYCDQCWPDSGYRDATDCTAEFSEMDSGESMEEDQ